MKLNLNNISIRWQLMAFSVLLVATPVLGVTLFGMDMAKKEVLKDNAHLLGGKVEIITHSLEASIDMGKRLAQQKVALLKDLLGYKVAEIDQSDVVSMTVTNQDTKESRTINVPALKINGAKMLHNYSAIDNMTTSLQGTGTIFQLIPEGLLRISTNVKNADGSRAVGTFIPPSSPVYQKIVAGESYQGRAKVVDDWYITYYEPIKNAEGKVIGALYGGNKENDFIGVTMQEMVEQKIGDTGYFFYP